MSKKATRRAARQAFPKAKTSSGTKSSGAASGQGSGKNRAKGTQGLRQPSWRRAVIQGAILAILYFVVIQYLWVPKDENGQPTANVWGSLLIAVIGFVAYSGIAYLVDRYTYNRKLRKLKGPAK
jgi:hypothetical protein